VSTGRYDALNGLYLKGDGRGGFSPASILQSGIFIPGNGKALVGLRSAGNKYLLAASENRGPLRIFELKKSGKLLSVQPSDVRAEIRLKNGKARKQELYYGSSFLSESSRFLQVSDQVESIDVFNIEGKKRVLE
jgi:hypothetical protein